jgi:hypothetical protein
MTVSRFKMNRYRFNLVLMGLLASGFLATSCQNTKQSTSVQINHDQWNGFGEAGPGKIVVRISGFVQRPGSYYLAEGTSLESVLSVFGGWDNPNDPPNIVRLRRETGEQYSIRLRKETVTEIGQLGLKNGDIIDFHKRLW